MFKDARWVPRFGCEAITAALQAKHGVGRIGMHRKRHRMYFSKAWKRRSGWRQKKSTLAHSSL